MNYILTGILSGLGLLLFILLIFFLLVKFKVMKNPFKKKEKTVVDYKVYIFNPSVDSMQGQFVIDTILKRDEDDKLLYLMDSKTKGRIFKELYPGENKRSFSDDEIPALKNRLKELNKKISNMKPTSVENMKEYNKQIYELEYLISQHEQGQGAFTITDSHNQKCVYYLRKPSGLYALHFDIHSNRAFSPTETQSKDLFMQWKQKYENIKEKPPMTAEKFTFTIAAIVLLVLCIVGGIGVYKILQYNTELDEAKIQAKYICQDPILEDLANKIKQDKENSDLMGTLLNQFIDDDDSKPKDIKVIK